MEEVFFRLFLLLFSAISATSAVHLFRPWFRCTRYSGEMIASSATTGK